MKKGIQLALVGIIMLTACKKSEMAPATKPSADMMPAAKQSYTTKFLNTETTNNYCISKGTNTTRGYINKVSMETINNLSGNNGGYGNFTSQSANLDKTATYTIELTPGFVNGAAYFEYWTVYIDYNQNGIFEANEIVAKGHNAIRINKSFAIPSTATSGPTRMRIQMQEGAQETHPCATYTYGEVEDYTVVIMPPPGK
jgi:bacillolysin